MDELSPAKRRLLEQWLQARAASRNARAIPHAAPGSDGTWPASFQQEDLCLRQWIEPDFTGFNNPKALRLRGPLQYEALKQGLAAVVARHAVLRTVYRFNDGEVRQQVMPMASPELPLQVLDAPDILQAERQSHCLALEFIRRPFDLSRDFSLRAVLYRLAKYDHLLLIVVHHIASDLTSHQHLLNDLARGYQDAINGISPPEPISIQYTDYAVWQRRSYADERLRLRSFWCKTLQGAPMLLPLAANSPATPAKESNVILHHWLVTESQVQAIDALASRFHSSRFMVILSLVAHLLRQITQQEDLLLGVTVNHRSQPELESLIGDLVDLLPVRLRFTEDLDDVGHLLQTTRDALLESLDHRDMPFSELVRELQPQRQEGRMPLIQTAVTYSENQIVQPQWPELTVEAIELARDHMALDMHWAFQAVGNDLACSLECATQRLAGNTMADLPARFQGLLERVIWLASSPDGIRQPVSRRYPHGHGDNDLGSSGQELVHLDLPNDAASLADVASIEDPISLGITLQPAGVGRFESLCRELNATLEMGLIALVAALLRRYCQQDVFTIGTVIEAPQPTGQPPSGSAGPVAVNTLAIPIRWRDGLSFRDLLQEVRLKRLTAADRVCHPSNTHPDDKPSQRDATPTPLLQVLLGLEVNLGSLNRAGEGGRPELFFGFERINAGLQVSVSYNPRRFLQARIDRAVNHLKILLDGMLADPVKPISQLTLLTAAEIHQLHSWGQGPELAVPQLCLHQLYERQVVGNPNAIALVFEGQSLTYGELNARANRMAHHLIGLGVRPDDRVAIAVERSFEMVVGLLAILKAGGAYVPLDPAYPEERLVFMLEDSAPVALLVHRATRERLASLGGAVPTIDLDADATEWEALTSA
ncbi:MAG: condensation domain-containing protein, partial [Cyanobium sp.]